jgi:two-component system sensor histidine kinase KdpD
MLQESERLYSVLLNSISHELRTPIATIMGAASGLVDPSIGASEQARVDLTEDIQAAAQRLNRLVENLLDMSRLESGRMRLKLDWCDVGDIIGVAAKRFDDCFTERPFKIHLQPDLPLVQLDYVLIEQVLVNLIDNACHYTPKGTQITLSAQRDDDTLEIVVADNGPGLPQDDFERVFEKFYRVKGSVAGGTGLGLSICRGLVEAHGGTMTAGNNADGGARFTIRLPAASPPPPVREAAV